MQLISSFLPGRFILEPGAAADYSVLERFHYRPRRPATWAGVWVVRYERDDRSRPTPLASSVLKIDYCGEDPVVVAAGVLSYPAVHCSPRERALNLLRRSHKQRLRFANAHVRTISRIIVHPQFRSLGLATLLIRHICAKCPTRYVEALATMGRVNPMFEQAGMTRVEPKRERDPVYFYLDRFACSSRAEDPAPALRLVRRGASSFPT